MAIKIYLSSNKMIQGPIKGLDDTPVTSEAKYSIDFKRSINLCA